MIVYSCILAQYSGDLMRVLASKWRGILSIPAAIAADSKSTVGSTPGAIAQDFAGQKPAAVWRHRVGVCKALPHSTPALPPQWQRHIMPAS